MKKCFPLLAKTITLGLFCLFSSTLYAGNYKIIDIGVPLVGYNKSTSIDMNNLGQLIGRSTPSDPGLPNVQFLLTPENGLWFHDDDANGTNDLMIVLDFGLNSGLIRAINDSGQIVGLITKPDEYSRGFLWDKGTITILGTLGNDPNPLNNTSDAFGINNNGDIVGKTSGGTVGGVGAIFIQKQGNMSLLNLPDDGSIGSGGASALVSINDLGEVSGTLAIEGELRPFFWRNGVTIDLGDLGGNRAQATAINNMSQVVGWSRIADGGSFTRAFLWGDGFLRNLGAIDRPEHGWAKDINNKGEVVGSQGGANTFLWLPIPAYGLNPGLQYMPRLLPASSGWVLLSIEAINDDGIIFGWGTFEGNRRAFVMIPPPQGIVVNSTGDASDSDPTDGECNTGNLTANGDPECTLRAAIEEANGQAGLDTIKFNIPSSGIPVIQPASALPEITDTVLIDGSTQPSTNQVEINGSQAFSGVVDGLRVSAGNSKVLNLLINKFSGNGLSLTNGDSNVVDGLNIGVGSDGIESRGNLRNGINITNSSANKIGESIGNIISQNGGAGVFVESGEGNTIRGNTVFSNGGLGIDLAPSGVNTNDPTDSDMGPNTLLNSPIIDSFFMDEVTGVSSLFGHIQGASGAIYIIDVFASGSCNSSGSGEGQTLLGVTATTADGTGLAFFQTTVSHLLDSSEVFTTTATDEAGNTSEFSPCMGLIHLKIVDVDDMILPNLNFIVSSVDFDRPQYTETLLDTFLTDSKGIISIPGHMLKTGDSLKVYRYLGSVPAVRHPALLGTMYSIHIDNAKFDPLGKMSYDERSTADTQKVTLDHSTFAFNMLISVQWDAELAYLDAWKPSIRKMANHLYDVSDGQMILDTVLILDNSAGWDEADIQVHTNNVLWPANLGDVGTIFTRPGSNGPIVFPRTGYGSKDEARRLSVRFDSRHFLDRNQYSTLLHEFFHYALAMWDEYKNRFNVYEIEWTRCDARKDQFNRYGVMDQHIDGQPYASEFSTIFRYPSGCRNNRQWWKTNMSCWDQIDMMFEKTYSGVKAPVFRPDERTLAPGLLYIPGPNDNTQFKGPADMDVDVGRLVVFPGVHISPPAQTYTVVVTDNSSSQLVAKAEVRLVDKSGPFRRTILQGQTSDQGELLALGVHVNDFLFSTGGIIKSAVGPFLSTWRHGGILIGGSNNQANGSMRTQAGNILNLVLDTVEGYFPLVPRLNLTADQLTLSLYHQKTFPSLPAVEHVSSQGSLNSFDFSVSGNSYVATVTDSLQASDLLTIQAVDDSGSSFFIPTELTLNRGSSVNGVTLRDQQFGVEITLDSINTSIEKSSSLTWSYPIIRTGLDSLSRQAGNAVALAFYPDIPLIGENSIAIRYGDSDALSGETPFGDKLSLQIFKWNESSFIWESIGGIVDTTNQVVAAIITESGVYAAFTTQVLPGCCIASTGNIDCDPSGIVDITDLTVLIDHLFLSLQPLCCKLEGNIDGDSGGIIDITDLTVLIDHLFLSLKPTSACQ